MPSRLAICATAAVIERVGPIVRVGQDIDERVILHRSNRQVGVVLPRLPGLKVRVDSHEQNINEGHVLPYHIHRTLFGHDIKFETFIESDIVDRAI